MKIGIIVTWFGRLPEYFMVWLKSAEYNKTIDFIIISDQTINKNSENILCIKSTIANETNKYEKILGRKVNIQDAYKFCDCRLFFGILYEDILKKYDFWGYCDIDLVFGDIRKFVTDELLSHYDRIYTYGHLCLYRNNEMMRHIYDLKGGIYSLDEIFIGKAKTTPEEHFGVNRICQMNDINVYQNVDYADINVIYRSRMEMVQPERNSEHQVFVWENGHAYRVYTKGNVIEREELVYIHWQKKKPKIKPDLANVGVSEKFIITPEKIILNFDENLTQESIDRFNPVVHDVQRKRLKRKYYCYKLKEFFFSSCAVKRIWIRQMRYRILNKI